MQSSVGSGQIFSCVEQGGAEEIVKIAVIGNVGDLRIGGGDSLVGLLLCEIGIHQATQTVRGGWIFVERLLVELFSVRILLLREMNLAELDVGSRALRGPLKSLLGILLSVVVSLPRDLAHALEKVTIGGRGLRVDD